MCEVATTQSPPVAVDRAIITGTHKGFTDTSLVLYAAGILITFCGQTLI